jgi:hypothetical protein
MTKEQTTAELFDELVARARKLPGAEMIAALEAIVAAYDRGMAKQ